MKDTRSDHTPLWAACTTCHHHHASIHPSMHSVKELRRLWLYIFSICAGSTPRRAPMTLREAGCSEMRLWCGFRHPSSRIVCSIWWSHATILSDVFVLWQQICLLSSSTMSVFQIITIINKWNKFTWWYTLLCIHRSLLSRTSLLSDTSTLIPRTSCIRQTYGTWRSETGKWESYLFAL